MIDFSYWYFFLLALAGAVVANATGAGGGVVFVPAFTLLGISEQSVIATSFAIQCFGMTAGSVAWYRHAKIQRLSAAPETLSLWHNYRGFIAIFSVPAIVGVVLGQYAIAYNSPTQIHTLFKWFSFLFAGSILATTWLIRKKSFNSRRLQGISTFQQLLCVAVGFLGGIVTAWLSIGVGELVAVTLILLRFPVRMAIGVAVSVSAVCVLIGVQKYIWIQPTISTQVLFFAAPAALLGGTVAKNVANLFSPVQLKIFIAAWILISAISM